MDPCYKTSFRKSTKLRPLTVALLLLGTLAWAGPSRAETARFFYMGDGTLTVAGQKITFRTGPEGYLPEGLKRLNTLFRAPWTPPEERLSLRFVEILDYVQDQLGGQNYSIRSGYRSPKLNQNLRNQGKLAAQSSMHIEGAAGDLTLSGVPSSQVFDFVKGLDCCGIGWYHSRHFHLDTGPSRYWDEKTSKTEDKTPQQNEKVILQTDFDRYHPGEEMDLKFMRVTQYPIGIPLKFRLKAVASGEAKVVAELPVTSAPNPKEEIACLILQDRSQARSLKVKLPEKKVSPGRYALEVSFCNRFNYEKMPETILSRSFEILP